MNYYARHLGDYAKGAGHLSMLEHGAYTLLLDRYYAAESPIAADQAHRMTRACSPEERAAVDAVLEEFFTLTADGWRHARCDAELEKYLDKSSKAQASANARWKRAPQAREPATGSDANAMRTHSDRSPEAMLANSQQPIAKNQSPEASKREPATPTPAGRACLLMLQAGCSGTNPAHPNLLAALAEGVTPEALADTAREGVEAGKAKPFAWAITTARSRHAEGAAPVTIGEPRHATTRPLSAVDRIAANVQRGQQLDAERGGDIIEGQAVRLAR